MCFGNWGAFLVATVLTACGIETIEVLIPPLVASCKLQQYLPLAVLKLSIPLSFNPEYSKEVATVLTACGIETNITV